MSGSHAHSMASASRGEFVKMRRALMTIAGGAAAALIAASPALAAGTWQVDSSPNPALCVLPGLRQHRVHRLHDRDGLVQRHPPALHATGGQPARCLID